MSNPSLGRRAVVVSASFVLAFGAFGLAASAAFADNGTGSYSLAITIPGTSIAASRHRAMSYDRMVRAVHGDRRGDELLAEAALQVEHAAKARTKAEQAAAMRGADEAGHVPGRRRVLQ